MTFLVFSVKITLLEVINLKGMNKLDLERSSRRSQNNQPKGGKKWLLALIVLLLLANTLGLGLLVYQSLAAPKAASHENERLTKIEEQLEKIVLDNQESTPSQEVKERSTETSQSDQVTESSEQNQVLASSQSETSEGTETSTEAPKTHIVEDGDSLSVLATKYHVTYEDLLKLNNLTNNIIVIGQELIISE